MLERFHLAHQGIQWTRAQAQKLMYWPGMIRDLEQMVGTCESCQRFQSKNQKESLLSHDIPELLWIKIGADICELEGHSYLVLVDYISKFPEVLHFPDKTAHTVIWKIKSVFARNGIPKEIVRDCAVRQSGDENVCSIVGNHSHKPQSWVSTVEWYGQKNHQNRVCDGLRYLQSKQQHYYNATAKALSSLSERSRDGIETKHGWMKAVVVRKTNEPHSYDVQAETGPLYRRNRRHLRSAAQEPDVWSLQ
ncbi:hypothetical protein H4Q32_028826 [Labeo rohita]|uniref:Gypsy retrotransposon integrase-like protein 1 n=1 Tax=Labeo rohita TaxID=84645 RepID=A0ABQ8L6T6_LABRO|nr:hypothetical protein H4Q32_028826 [Labeo rohita]